MAPGQPSKRPRAPTTDGDLRNGRGKRPRHSLSPSSDEDDSSENGSEHSESATSPDNESEELFRRQTQRMEKRLKNSEAKQNIPAECGIIQEISCTNFMCHEQLVISLGPLINFIIGHNGSGKSAVLTALTLCLGGKAAATNRGQNLKSFIKEGRDHSTIRVRIKNEGIAAYRADLYGKSITVERHFTRSGASGFKLKDENGKLVSTKKADLEDIIDAFAMQIDNPMNVLTQDMARQFLNDSTPKDKYKFFLKGTQLQALKDDYSLMMAGLEEMESKCATLKSDVQVLHTKYQTAVEKARRADSLEEMKTRETLLAHQQTWAEVERREKEVVDVDGEIEHTQRLIDERRRTAEIQSAQYDSANESYSQVNQTIQDKQAEIHPKKQELEEMTEQWNQTKAALLRTTTQERDIAMRAEAKEKSIEKYQSQIHEHRQRQAEADGGQHAQKVSELEEAQRECARAREDLANHEIQMPTLVKELKTAQRRKEDQEGKVKEKMEGAARARQLIQELEQGQGNWVDAYPNPANLPKLLRAIENERGFRERPVGPMGRHVKLLKPEWSSLLETSSGSSLNAFVVTSKSDQVILSDLMRRMNCNYPIFVGSNTRLDTTPNEPDPRFDTWLKVLTIDNNLVRNQLILNHQIEKIVLCPDKQSADDLMYGDVSGRHNISMCFFRHEKDPTKGNTLSVNQNSGSVNFGHIRAFSGRPRMQADKEPQLRAARNNLERLQRDHREAATEANEQRKELDACQRKIDDHKRLKTELTIRLQTAESDVERLELELSAATPDTGVLEQLEESLREAQEAEVFERGQLEDIMAQRIKLSDLSREQMRSKVAAQREIEQSEMELDKLSKNAEKLKAKREQALREKNAALEEVQEAENTKKQWEERRGQAQANLTRDLAMAEQICPRVEVPRGETYASLDKKRQRLARERAESERELGGSRAEVTEAAATAKMLYLQAEKTLKSTEKLRQGLNHSVNIRNQRWDLFRNAISTTSKVTFGYLLSDRQFRGELKIDHVKHLLDIQVQPDITVASGAGRQTKTLSGGEKSFSTICLLLSLWDAMGSPIRCLDEFDVFMDSVNRDISMKMMISAARRAIGRQYILITPQAMNSIQSVGDVKIIKMNDPERGQTALNIGRR